MSDTTAPRVELIDPAAAVIGENVRLDPRLDKEFLASIRERGVLTPVVVTQDDDGRYLVRSGQRRTLAAAQVGRSAIPAYVVASTGEADRIVDQLAENEHRSAVTTGERVTAMATLAGLGLTAAQIAKRTATPRATVDSALTVAASEPAARAAATHTALTLDEAVVIADFADDPEAVGKLVEATKDGEFAHVAQRLRDDRQRTTLHHAAVQQLLDAGVVVLEGFERYGEHKRGAGLGELAGSGKTKGMTPEAHAACPGHAAYVTVSRSWQNQTFSAHTTYVCLDWRANGHKLRHGSSPKPTRDEMNDEQREQARAERRDVIESNKAWEAAQPVRIAWITQFLTRRTAPKGTAPFVALAIASRSPQGASLDTHEAREMARKLGVVDGKAETITKAAEARALVIALGVVLAAYEAKTGRHSWRNVDAGTALYLRFLAGNGYDLSNVERRAAGMKRGA